MPPIPYFILISSKAGDYAYIFHVLGLEEYWQTNLPLFFERFYSFSPGHPMIIYTRVPSWPVLLILYSDVSLSFYEGQNS